VSHDHGVVLGFEVDDAFQHGQVEHDLGLGHQPSEARIDLLREDLRVGPACFRGV
jgi:hypothetical protein